MIRYIKGMVMEKGEDTVVIVTSDGVGYGVVVASASPLLDDLAVDTEVDVYTSQQFRENEQSLYGFSSPEERNFFELLITVSGVGPKLAANLLAHIERRELAEMIVNEDVAGIVQVPGVGKKMAERLIVDLRDKALGEVKGEPVKARVDRSEEVRFLSQALERLGFSASEREAMLENVESHFSEGDESVEDVLKKLLAGAEGT